MLADGVYEPCPPNWRRVYRLRNKHGRRRAILMNEEDRLSDRDMAIEGYGNTYKGVLPDGTVTGLMSYDGKVFEHYVNSGENVWRHQRWERDYEATPLRTPLELLGTGQGHSALRTDECFYNGVQYSAQPMESCGMSGWRYDLADKRAFERLVLKGDVKLPAPAVFSKYGNIYIESGHEAEVLDLYANWAESYGTRHQPKTRSGAD